jgi:isoprenylcysteine carboxyl methyltransferase (ICMT) family protein YpbQ
MARAWEVGSIIVSLTGLTIRVIAVATAPAGTSERSTRNPRASTLRTTGLYSTVRHPLYLANLVMILGLALFPAVWYLPIIVTLAGVLYYERIAAHEEAFLDQQFGAAFRDWAAEVPALMPSFRRILPSTSAFSWRRVARSEFHGLMVIAAGAFLLDAVQESLIAGRFRVDRLWMTTFAVSAAVFLVMAVLKKTTHLLDVAERAPVLSRK